MNIFKKLFSDYIFKEIGGLTDELKCIYISNQYNNNKILVVCNSLYEANKFYQTLKNYINDVYFFPMDDFMTSEVLAISPDFKMTRLETLDNIIKNNKGIVVTNLMGYLRFLPTKENFVNSYIKLKIGDSFDIKDLVQKFYNIGYERNITVDKTGEMAIRGYVVDIFPINYDNPIRIEFWGDEIESIRLFDINTQLTIDIIKEIEIIPNSEFLIDKDIDFEYRHRDLVKYGSSNIYEYLNGLLFYNELEDINISYENLLQEVLEYNLENSIQPNTKYFNDFPHYDSINLYQKDTLISSYNSYKIEDKFISVDAIREILNKYIKKNTIIICVSSRYQANKIMDEIDCVFTSINEIYENKINVVVFNINEGFKFNNYIFISENEIFNKNTKVVPYKTNFKYGTRIKDVTKLEIGDYIVHNIHGIGRYLGMKTITKNGLNKDYLQLEYKGGDKLYIPVEKIEMISKYSSKEGYEPKLNKLGTSEWTKVKLKAKSRAKDIANELLKLFALRQMSSGFKFVSDDDNQIQFEKEFPYEETVDQLKVLEEIKKDMESDHPMDRLLCGDVGYGKTEIAFRAAFKAILSGKQVALLCPTTILSNQHYQNALERFKSFPVNIRLVNRFMTSKKFKEVVKDLKEGKVDFVIGTHKLLNDEIVYKDLGLLIIDEEQRFGVTHKEKIKNLKNNIDVLTLSATPIPRTLQMSLSGIRSLSTIETPPSNRYPVQTYVVSYNKKLIKDAIYKELSRGGQVFLLYNRIDSMNSKLEEIKQLVPDAKVVCANGRMNKTELEDIMLKFINHEFDVLLCTTIIETGIDIPNANTLIVIDADKFGLSQLYQLRGRVGRTNKIAYCYLMYDNSRILSETAHKRLSAIKEFTELGSGLSIAMRDLSLRGAGDFLGSEQAGFVDSVGIELFTQMLKQEIDKLKGIEVTEEVDSQPLIEVDTYIDDNYVKEEELKIEIHKKINEIDSYDKLLSVQKELEDRFGKISDKLLIYMYEEWFESLANKLKIKRVKQTNNTVEIMLDKEMLNNINGEQLFLETLKINNNFSFKMLGNNLIITLRIDNLEKHFIYYLIDLLFIIQKSIKTE